MAWTGKTLFLFIISHNGTLATDSAGM